MLSNMTIKARLTMLVSVIMVISVVVAAFAFIGMSNLQTATEDIAVRRVPLIRSVNKLMYVMADNRAQLMRAMQHDPANPASKFHDHPVSRHLDAIVENNAKIEEYLSGMERETHSEEGRRLLGEFQVARTVVVNEGLQPGVQAVKDGQYNEAAIIL
jgi:hypothetical protein